MDLTCPKCGTTNKDNSRFCAACGEALPDEGSSAPTQDSAPALDLPWLQTVQDRAVKQTGRLSEPSSRTPEAATPQPTETGPGEVEQPTADNPSQPPQREATPPPVGASPAQQPTQEQPQPSQPPSDPNEPPPNWVLGILEPSAGPAPNPDQAYEPEELAHIMPWAHSESASEQAAITREGPAGLPPWLDGVTVQETLQTASAGAADKAPDPMDLGIEDIEPFIPPLTGEHAVEDQPAAQAAPVQVPEWLRTLSPGRDKQTPAQGGPTPSQTNLHEVPIPTPDVVLEPVVRHSAVRPPRAGAVEALSALVQSEAAGIVQPGVRLPSTVTSVALRPERKRPAPIAWLLPDGLIYLAILAVLLSVLIVRPPFGDVTTPAASGAQEFYTAIKDSPGDKPVLVVYDWDATRSAEMSVLSQAVMRQLMSSQRRFITISTTPQGPGFAEQITRNMRDRYGYEYEREYLVLGYLPGNEAALNALVNNFSQSLPRDYIYNRNVNGTRLVAGGQLNGIDDFGLIIALPSEEAELRNWIEQVGTRINVPIVAAVPQGLEPLARPYLNVERAGLKALLSGLAGALQYNRQLDSQPGSAAPATGALTLTDRLNTQSVAQVLLALVILAAIIRIGVSKILRR